MRLTEAAELADQAADASLCMMSTVRGHRRTRGWAAIFIGLVVVACAGETSDSAATDAPTTVAESSTQTVSPQPSGTVTSSSPSPSGRSSPVWQRVAEFGEPAGFTMATELVRGETGYLAIGQRTEGAAGGAPGFGPVATYLWASADGEAWEELPTPPGLEGALPTALITTPEREFVIYSSTPTGPEATWELLSLRSNDGRTWEPFESGLAPGTSVVQVVHGSGGYLLMEQTPGQDAGLWLSQDGLTWEQVHRFEQTERFMQVSDIGAGEEGFVAIGQRIELDTTWQRFTVASADGREWVESLEPFGPQNPDYRPDGFVSSLGPDWIAVLPNRDESVQFWVSANGLAWEPAGTIPDVGTSFGWIPELVEADGRLFFSPYVFAPDGPPGVWTSTDGHAWAEIETDFMPVLGDVIAGPDRLILVGGMRLENRDMRAAFWYRSLEDAP